MAQVKALDYTHQGHVPHMAISGMLELERGLEERRIQFASAVASTPLDFRASVPVWRNRQKLPRGLSAATYHSIPAAHWRCKSTVLVFALSWHLKLTANAPFQMGVRFQPHFRVISFQMASHLRRLVQQPHQYYEVAVSETSDRRATDLSGGE